MAKSKTERRFLGEHPKAGVKQTNFKKKELRAYLRGQKTFRHGLIFMPDGSKMRDERGNLLYHTHEVRQSIVLNN